MSDPGRPPPLDPHQAWRQALEQLRLTTTRATFDAWLRGTRLVDHDPEGNTWTISAATVYAADWLEHRLDVVVRRALDAVYPAGAPARCVYVAREASDGPPPASDDGLPSATPAAEPPPVVPIPAAVAAAAASALKRTDVYVKLKAAFRQRALAELRGPALSVFLCLALHVDGDGIAHPTIDRIMTETGYNSRTTICSALDKLCSLGLIEGMPRDGANGPNRYRVLGYAWMGSQPAPCLWEGEG